ncbi:MAG: S4 domain-containing protein, partial [Candidatus Saccharicenans sp.]
MRGEQRHKISNNGWVSGYLSQFRFLGFFLFLLKYKKTSQRRKTILRINRFLAQAGVASRREADRMIQEGRVKLNGQVVTKLGLKVDERSD